MGLHYMEYQSSPKVPKLSNKCSSTRHGKYAFEFLFKEIHETPKAI